MSKFKEVLAKKLKEIMNFLFIVFFLVGLGGVVLYFIVKNHSFVDGNKRIAASIFLWFLERNSLLYRSDGTKRIADNAIVALTLMIAESDPKERDIIVTLVINLINRNN